MYVALVLVSEDPTAKGVPPTLVISEAPPFNPFGNVLRSIADPICPEKFVSHTAT